MAISNSTKAKLNKSNRAAQDASLGTVIQTLQTAIGFSGSKTVTNAEVNGSRVVITTGITAPKGIIAQVTTTGSVFSGIKITSGSVSGDYLISNGSAVSPGIPAGAIVTYFGFA